MAARTVSELANWDGHLSQQRQNPKWRHSSSSLARDSFQAPLENQPFGILQPPTRSADQKRADQSSFRSNPERDTLANSPANARFSSRVDTTSTPSHDVHHFPHPSISHVAPNSVSQRSPFIASSKSSQLTSNSSVHISRVHNCRPSSSRERNPALLHASTSHSEVIDLTMEDTDDELLVRDALVPSNMHFSGKNADPGPSHRPSSSGYSSPIAPEQSLFTPPPPPPPPRRRARLFINFIKVPSFPNGLTKADYLPMPAQPGLTVTSNTSPLAESLLPKERTHPPQKWKGKEREHNVVSPRKKYKRLAPTKGAATASSAFLDAFYDHTMIPLQDDDSYPPLTSLDLATNTRFYFAHAWRGHASRLREDELDRMIKFKFGNACIWAQSTDTPSPRIPGTAGCVSTEQLRPWELVPPDSSPQEKTFKTGSDEQTYVAGGRPCVEVGTSHLPLSDGALPVASVTSAPAPSNSTVLSTVVDMEQDMNQYFDGLSDSPSKPVPRQHLVPTHTFRSHQLQFAGRAQMDPVELGFPSMELDLRLADTGGHECLLGLPPSPITVDMDSSTAPDPSPDSPFEPMNHLTAPPIDVFAEEAPFTHAWSFEQGEGLPENSSPPNDCFLPTTPCTIDPSLLGPEQPQTPPPASKATTSKRRSNLPEPVIYIRRPTDSSALPLVSGKRPVQIKYRDPEGSSATPPSPTGSKGPSSNPAEGTALSTNEMSDSPQAKRRSAPSRKLREHQAAASESDSDYVPETIKSSVQPRFKIKRPNARDKESVVDHRDADATMSFCHQCRNTSKRPKMTCSNNNGDRVCGKRFCNRCILNRYPEITFDEDSAGFLCPACTNTCNCSVCSRNRGEEFVSMRLGGLAASFFKTKVTLVRDVNHRAWSPQQEIDTRRSASGATTPTPEPGAMPVQPQFWAHVYGLEGERMGSAFMTRAQMERLQTRGASTPPPVTRAPKPTRRKKKREQPRGPRVFIGWPLTSWNVGEVRDLEPSVDVDDNDRSASTAGSRRRVYIGNPGPLHEPYGRMPGMMAEKSLTPPSSRCSTPMLDSDGSLTSLSELEADYWPQPEVGECCSWAPPPPPGEGNGFAMEVGGGPGAAAAGLEALLGLGASGSSTSMGVDMDAPNGDAQVSTSTVLSEQDVARAISAALAALSVNPPS